MDEKDWFTEQEIDNYTLSLVDLIKKIAQVAELEGKSYFIGSGFAIDLNFGKISRNHHDVDFHPMIEDTAWWIDWFIKQDLLVKNGEHENFPDTWEVFNKQGEVIVDMWPFKLQDDFLLVNFKGGYIKDRPLRESRAVNFQQVNIWIADPRRVLDQKWRETQINKEIRPQDAHDFKLFGKELKIEGS